MRAQIGSLLEVTKLLHAENTKLKTEVSVLQSQVTGILAAISPDHSSDTGDLWQYSWHSRFELLEPSGSFVQTWGTALLWTVFEPMHISSNHESTVV